MDFSRRERWGMEGKEVIVLLITREADLGWCLTDWKEKVYNPWLSVNELRDVKL